MKVIYYFLLILSVVLWTRCSTDEIEKFDERNYISFDVNEIEEGYPELSYTFTFSEESVREAIYEVPVVYAGRYNNKVVSFSWQVVEEESTAVLNTHYQLLDGDASFIEAGKNVGVAKIKLLRTGDMQNNFYELVLQLVENKSFKPGAIDRVKIVITDQLVKPDYWVWDPYDHYLGNYSSMKFRLWLEFMNVSDGANPFETDKYIQWTDRGTGNFIYKNYRESEVKTTVLEFRQWLYNEKNNPYDEDLKAPVAESLGGF